MAEIEEWVSSLAAPSCLPGEDRAGASKTGSGDTTRKDIMQISSKCQASQGWRVNFTRKFKPWTMHLY